MSTIKDVAKMAGVSISTVSLAYNSPERVSETTKKRIYESAKMLEYVPMKKNTMAALKKEQSETIAVMCPKLIGAYFFELLRGISETLYMNKMNMVTYFGDDVIGTHFMRIVEKRMYKGVILINGPLCEEYLQAAKEADFPTVLCSYAKGYRGIGSVITDNEGIGKLVADHFVKQKFQKIAVVGTGAEDSAIRWEAFIHTLEKNGITIPDEWILPCELTEEAAYRVVWRFLNRAEDHPRAIFCLNDDSAIGAMDAIRDFGYRIPEDIAVVGCDDVDRSRYYTPSLSTVSIPKMEMGMLAVNMLMRRISGLPAEEIVLNGKLILRDSCP